MGSEVVIIPIIFGVIFAIVYLYFSTRNKERLALIEKGADASIFFSRKRGSMWKVITLNFAFLLIGIGVGAFLGSIIDEYTRLHEGAIVGIIFIMAGIGLYVGFTQARKYIDNE